MRGDVTTYQFTDDMHEISGFGGDYEECCRRMLGAALRWLDDHPKADPKFGPFGQEENADAKALSAAALQAAEEMGYGASGAQHGAAISHALWVRKYGWAAYVREKAHPDGHVGLLKEKVAKLEADLKSQREWGDRLQAENRNRGAIIAERVLGWKRHKTSNNAQEAYGPNREAVLGKLYAGCSLSKLVDEAIAAMQVAA